MFDQPSYNSLQDQTGSNGALPDAEYNLYCPANGGPDWKLNYFKASCAIRLEKHSCKTGDCPRFVGEKPKKVAGGSQEHHKKPRREPARRIHKCLCCSKEKFIQGRGLCRPCYNFHSVRGILDNYPKTRNLGATRAKT
jgi:hypothetical protein